MSSLYNPDWHKRVESALIINDPKEIQWHDEADVVVVGFGGAGVCTAIEAADNGASVIAIDRFNGGGATYISGGVTYLGGGTKQQKEACVDDTPEEMYKYLQMETKGIVQEDTLRRFCNTSQENQQWLESNGVQLNSSLSPVKTSYPGKPYYLYYSGNETVPDYAEKAKPAQRGHRAAGKGFNGFSGPALFDPLKAAALAKGVKLSSNSRVKRLITSSENEVLGVEIVHFPKNLPITDKHDFYSRTATKARIFAPPLATYLSKKIDQLENSPGVTIENIRAHKGVVICTGGFIQNREMVNHFAPKYKQAMPLGDIACDGSGILLGKTAGGAIDHMEKVSAWRFINPPLSLAQGIVVNTKGERYCNEQVYGAKLGYHMVEENEGRAIAIMSRSLLLKAFKQALAKEIWYFQSAPMLITFLLKKIKGNNADHLAEKLGIPADTLKQTINTYNKSAEGEQPDILGKSKEFLANLGDGPYYAFDISIDSKTLPCATITFGGLVVNEETGQVVNEDRTPIKGLFAAGRAAIGIPTRFYVSGLSIADCIFSGRRAGKYCANL